jgi:hypothetical protein
MVLAENAALVGLGFLAGAIPALVAIAPMLLGGRGAVPLPLVGGLIAGLAVTGALVSWAAVAFIRRLPPGVAAFGMMSPQARPNASACEGRRWWENRDAEARDRPRLRAALSSPLGALDWPRVARPGRDGRAAAARPRIPERSRRRGRSLSRALLSRRRRGADLRLAREGGRDPGLELTSVV